MRKHFITICLIAVFIFACAPKGVLRYPPYKWMADEDRTPIEKPKSRRTYNPTDSAYSYVYEGWDIAMGTVESLVSVPQKVVPGGHQEALNVDNFDEVPDSTWFTNRLGRYDMDLSEIAKPFDPDYAPSLAGKLVILSANTFGDEPRLYAQDSIGRRYVIKFDPPGAPGIATGAEMISSVILRNAGYNVPNNYIIDLNPNYLALSPDAVTRGKYAKQRPMTDGDLKTFIGKIDPHGNGRVRAIATTLTKGEPLGPFSFKGTRYGDANDVIAHQHRRELRGYRVFAALTNNLHIRDSGTMDLFMPSNPPLGYIEHNIFDLSTAFGNSWILTKRAKKDKTAKEEEKEDLDYGYGGAAAAMFTFGLYKPPTADADCYDKYDGLAFLPTCRFHPGKWDTVLANDAFLNMTERDAFWAARIIMRLSDEAIASIVKLAQLPSKRLERYVIAQLIGRRDMIGSYWFSKLNPLDDFVIEKATGGVSIGFKDLAVSHGFTKQSDRQYRYMIETRMGTAEITPWKDFYKNIIFIDDAVIKKLLSGRIYILKIQTFQKGYRWPMPSVDLYIVKDEQGDIKILGLQRRYR